MAPALAVRGLTKRYGSTDALGGVDLEVAEGELVGLLGPNGAGKSTLVKIACGLVRPSAGTAEICGAPSGSPPARAALGYLAELFRFPGWMTADELLRLHQRLAGSTGGAEERRELLGLVGLAESHDRRVDAMSKGMQQRLGIAQALVGSPRLLLLDEPTSALDPAGRRTVRRLLEELRGRGIAVLLNSHLLSEVELVCDRVAILSRGLLVREGKPSELAGAGGVEVETAGGMRQIPKAGRDDVPAIVGRSRRLRRADLRRPRRARHAGGRVPRSRRGRERMRAIPIIVGHTIREAVRRKIFLIVLLLTIAFVTLYALATHYAFRDASNFAAGAGPADVDTRIIAGSILQGLAMFGTLFLGTVLAIFLTLGAVRGDAERGLLQPLVVRPLGRATFLAARFVGAAAICAGYVLALYGATVLVTGLTGHWWPDRLVTSGIELAAAVVVVVALSLLGSVFLTSTANGIAVFMLFGAGLVAGLLGQIGDALHAHTLSHVARYSSFALPFEALYQDSLNHLTSDTVGFTRYALQLGPFGGAEIGGGALLPWVVGYVLAVLAVAVLAFRRADL